MQNLFPMENPIQDYAWGSHSAIAELKGRSGPTIEPQAELWMGAHPKAPSKIKTSSGWELLPEAISKEPQRLLGDRTVSAQGEQLPYLFKILAAQEPLSIQAHPSQIQAREGYAREDGLGIPLNAPNRNYRDPNHKPELVCALSPFWALCGFRPVAEIRAQLIRLCPGSLAEEINALSDRDPLTALRRFFASLMEMDPVKKELVLEEALGDTNRLKQEEAHFSWIVKLGQKYPGDVGILAPLFLNCLCLEPGQALFLPAGELHAYLDGTAIEVMANSDNVLRGGLTPKHVDPPELLRVLTFQPRIPNILTPQPLNPHESRYPTWASEFQLGHIHLEADQDYVSPPPHGAEILLCVEGQARIEIPETAEALTIPQGESVFISAASPQYRITGKTGLYKVGVPSPADVR